MIYHKPVLLAESIEGLNIKPDGIYVDVTFGGGGHSKEILKDLKNGFLYGFDQERLIIFFTVWEFEHYFEQRLQFVIPYRVL